MAIRLLIRTRIRESLVPKGTIEEVSPSVEVEEEAVAPSNATNATNWVTMQVSVLKRGKTTKGRGELNSLRKINMTTRIVNMKKEHFL